MHQQNWTFPSVASCRLILDSVGEQVLAEIAKGYVDLLGTSLAVYEFDGTYALSISASNWCRFLNEASRSLCRTDDDSEAMESGNWHCHESCWNDASKVCIEKGQPVDVRCRGGIRIFAAPIMANAEVVGSIAVGYGDPPGEPDQQQAIAAMFGVALDDLQRHARDYAYRPAYVIEAAKEHLLTSAKLIGVIVEHNRMQNKLRESEDKFRVIFKNTGAANSIIEQDTTISLVNAEFERLSGYRKEEIEWRKSWTEFVAAGELERLKFYHRARRMDSGSAPRNYEYQFVDRYGNIKDVYITVDMIPGTQKSIASLLDLTEHKRIAAALRQSEGLCRTIFETSGTAMMIVEGDYTISLVNSRFEELTGFAKAEVEGKKEWLYRFPEGSQKEILRYHSARMVDPQGAPDSYEVSFLDRKGELREVSVNARGIPGTAKSVVSFLDLTSRKRAEAALRLSEERFRTLVESASEMIVILDRDGTITYVSPSVQCILGYENSALNGQDVFGLFHPADLQGAQEVFVYLLQNPGVSVFKELRVRHKDGSWRVLAATGRNYLSDASVAGVIVNCRNITSRKRVEKKVRTYQKQLRSLASELMFAEERERRRIAGELHDLIGQNLAVAKINLGAIQDSLSGDGLKDLLGKIEDSIEQTIECTRSLVFELSPPVLYELGLEAALGWLAEMVQQRHGIKVNFADGGNSTPINQETRVTLFKAVRELLLNVVKHAGARNVSLTVTRNGGYVEVTVKDDGVGFDVARTTLRTSQSEGGFGLFSIRERLKFLGGRMKVKSQLGKGTECTLIAPL